MTGSDSQQSGTVSKLSARSKPNAEMSIVSRQSGRVTFLKPIERDAKSGGIDMEIEKMKQDNPFAMPSDNDIFSLRDKEKVLKKQEREEQKKLKVHQKSTFSSKIKGKTSKMIKPVISDEEADGSEEDDDGRTVAVKNDPQFTLGVTRDRNIEKESLTEYINKKREMFLVQFSLGVKRDEMRKLEEIARKEEQKLEQAEQYLENDALMFDEFLKENDKNSVEAIKVLENETKAKLELVTEIKKLNAQMLSIKSDITKDDDTLKELRVCRKFLESISPKDWLLKQQERKRRRVKDRKSKEKVDKNESLVPSPENLDSKVNKKRAGGKKSSSSTKSSSSDIRKPSASETEDSASDSEPELFFSEPEQLMNIYSELEEQNLTLILNSQDTEEAMEEMKLTIKKTKVKMEKETEILKEQIDKLNKSIQEAEEKAKDLEYKAKMFDFGEFQGEQQEEMIASLKCKVEEVYKNTIGHNEANISTLEMLTNIENRLEEIFETLEMLPPEKVEAAEKALDKERRLKLREEKLKLQKEHQEERIKRASERAKADPKKKTGRKIVARSEPPKRKKENTDADDQANREEEEYQYFFT